MGDFDQFSEGFPRTFGPYLLLSAFAHGGMGEVYLAKAGNIAGIERLCVLKKLRNDLVQNEEYVKRFLDEARLVVQLNHANIAHVFDVGTVNGEYYLAMEYVSGVSLKELSVREVTEGRATPVDIAVFLMAEALEGLDYAHRLEHPATGQPLNLVHRDISPHNVMASYEGESKLIDFGLAVSELKEEQTESQVVMGKVAYMAPEQARGERVNKACDQFAAGIVLYELIAGARFYGDMNNYQIWQVVGRGGYTPTGWAQLDPQLQPVLGRALHPDAAQRWPTCGDFKDALMAWLVPRFPKTSRRRVREHIRELFTDASQKERDFLHRFSGVNFSQVDSGSVSAPPTENTSSVSLMQRSSGPDHTMTLTPFSGEVAPIVPRGDTDSTATHLLATGERRVPEAEVVEKPRSRAGLLLLGGSVVIFALGGFGLMRALQDEPKPRREPVVARSMVVEPATTEPATTGPATTESATAEAATAEAATAEAATAEAATAEAVTAEAATAEAATAEAATAEAAAAEPVKARATRKRARKAAKTTRAATVSPPVDAKQPDKAPAGSAMSDAERQKWIKVLSNCQLATAKNVVKKLKDPNFVVSQTIATTIRTGLSISCEQSG